MRIPACAGEPSQPFFRASRLAVYLRVCGGTVNAGVPEGEIAGLSPRVRGNPHSTYGRYFLIGSIPACAGEPWGGRTGVQRTAVYPRVCGGTYQTHKSKQNALGLSPRVRGNRIYAEGAGDVDRSIPACAGEPCPQPWHPAPAPVYPRVCGGTVVDHPAYGKSTGLSPRVRGNHGYAVAWRNVDRSIPACAGEPWVCRRLAQRGPVYPRVCGGTGKCQPCQEWRVGLSPRVRGNPQLVQRLGKKVGSIPACAGEPVVLRSS